MALPPLILRVVTDTRGAQRGLLTFRAAAKGAIVGLAALGAGAFAAFRQFEDAQKHVRQTNAVLKSTGGVANVTARDISRLSTSLMKKAAIDDEVIRGGANLLLTFTKIRNETGKGNAIFDRATKAALDMSVAMDQDLKSSVIQVGKALNDPIKGMTALRRVGVSFTDAQTEMVQKWVESGDVLKAQKFVLQELNTEFGGSAEAQRTATAAMGVAFGELAETVGKFVAPAIEFLIVKVTEFANFLERNVGPAVKAVSGWMEDNAGLVKTLATVVAALTAAYLAWKVATGIATVAQALLNTVLLANPFALIAVAVIATAAVIVANWSRIKGFLIAVWNGLKDFAIRVWNAITGAFVAAWNAIKGPVLAVINTIKGAVLALVGAIRSAVEWITKLGSADIPVINGRSAMDVGGVRGEGVRRQHGGPVNAWTPYIVGEAGPEWFVPKVSGTVLPNDTPAGVTINVHGDVNDSRIFERKVVRAIERAAARS